MNKLLLTAVTLAGFASICTAAENAKPAAATASAPLSVQQMYDTNRDNVITLEEMSAYRKVWMKEMDVNKDGKLQSGEYRADVFKLVDVNRDGTVTIEEFMVFFTGDAKDAMQALPEAAKRAPAKTHWFQKRDANGDGKVDRAEWVAYWVVTYKAADSNHDGKLTSDEFKAFSAAEFKEMDTDNDGNLTEAEFSMIAVPVAKK